MLKNIKFLMVFWWLKIENFFQDSELWVEQMDPVLIIWKKLFNISLWPWKSVNLHLGTWIYCSNILSFTRKFTFRMKIVDTLNLYHRYKAQDIELSLPMSFLFHAINCEIKLFEENRYDCSLKSPCFVLTALGIFYRYECIHCSYEFAFLKRHFGLIFK